MSYLTVRRVHGVRSVNASAASFARSLTFRLSPHVADASVSGATPAASALPVVQQHSSWPAAATCPRQPHNMWSFWTDPGVPVPSQIRHDVVFDRSTRSRRAFGQRVRRQCRQVSDLQVVAPRGRRVSVRRNARRKRSACGSTARPLADACDVSTPTAPPRASPRPTRPVLTVDRLSQQQRHASQKLCTD